MVWVGRVLIDHLILSPLLGQRHLQTKSVYPKPDPTWPWTLPQMEYSQFLWTVCSSTSLPSSLLNLKRFSWALSSLFGSLLSLPSSMSTTPHSLVTLATLWLEPYSQFLIDQVIHSSNEYIKILGWEQLEFSLNIVLFFSLIRSQFMFSLGTDSD